MVPEPQQQHQQQQAVCAAAQHIMLHPGKLFNWLSNLTRYDQKQAQEMDP